MKKIFTVFLLAVLCVPIFAQTSEDTYQEIRQLLYSENPVDKVRELSSEDLNRLISKISPKLAENEKLLAFELLVLERCRRTKTNDEFSLMIQETKEDMKDYNKQKALSDSTYIKIDTWLDLFRLNLMFD